MKKVLFIITVALFGCIPLVAFSEDTASKNESMMGKKMMMPCLMSKQIVATNDGLIVMTGNKLLKYDKNLKLIKEAEIPMDTSTMEKMMQMRKKGMRKGSMQEGPAKEGAIDTQGSRGAGH